MKRLIGLTVTLLFVFAATAFAGADWEFYGNARMTTFSYDKDVSADQDQRLTRWELQGNSRIGANVKTDDNGIGGRFEYGTGVNLRHLYGTWNFGSGELLVGHTETPITYWESNQVWDSDLDLEGLGMPNGGRQPMIQLKIAGFKLALVTPNTSDPVYPALTIYPPTLEVSTETTFPKIETCYNFKADIFYINGFAGYNTYNIKQSQGSDETVSAAMVGAGFGVTPGAFFFKGMAYYALNPVEYGLVNYDSGVSTLYDPLDSTVTDVNSWGGLGVIGFKFNDMFTAEAGYGYVQYELDQSGADTVSNQSYYLNTSVTLAPGFFIVPEIGIVDLEEIGDNDNDLIYFGAKWQINF